jgi:hypothetical protein
VSGDQPPPPGWGEPQAPPPGWEPPPPPAPQPGWGQFAALEQSGWQPYPQQPRPPYRQLAAHKPGAIPLRPLGLGDLYDGAFKIIRYNPKATIGAAVLVAAAWSARSPAS